MTVVKRDGRSEPVHFDKVLSRIDKAAQGLQHVNPTRIAQQVVAEIVDGIHTSKLDELTGEICAMKIPEHPEYGTLAARIETSNLQKLTSDKFSVAMGQLVAAKDVHGKPAGLIRDDFYRLVQEHAEALDAMIVHERDFLFDYFGLKTLQKGYLMRVDGFIVERPQYLWMRVALAIHGHNLARVQETYDLLSQLYFTHATPTLFNMGTNVQQGSSCFVKGTLVHTMDGVKPIEEVKLGDMVVTHKGAVKKVSQLHANPLGDRKVWAIKTAGTPTIHVTGNHRLMSLSSEQEGWGQGPQWNAVEYLRVGDWIAIPNKSVPTEDYVLDVMTVLKDITSDGNTINYTYTCDDDWVYPSINYVLHRSYGDVKCCKTLAKVKRHWVFNNDMMRLLGIWYGDGSITHNRNSAKQPVPKNVNIVSYHTNKTLIEFVTSKFRELLGVEHVTVSKDQHGMVGMIVNSEMIANIFKAVFRCKFDGKRIPAFFNTMGYEHIRHFLAGLVSSDGCVATNGSVQMCFTNPPMVHDIFYLARSVNIPITLTMMKTGADKPTGRMSVPYSLLAGLLMKHYDDCRLETLERDRTGWRQTRIINGTYYVRLNSKILSELQPETVYTLGVEDDHSYSVGGIIAENCFLLNMKGDSIDSIFQTLHRCAMISKLSGGIGLAVHNVRASGSHIRSTNGKSSGLVPMLRVFNDTARYVDQAGKRKGSFAIYLEPWHADVESFLQLKKNTGAEEERARDLFLALWVPDLFMKRVEADEDWTLMCPDECPGLSDCWGPKFDELYTQYERENRGRRTIKARMLWMSILESEIETGVPYLLAKDAANRRSNQQNLGTIKSSNLCAEIIEYTDANEIAVCNLASLGLPRFVENGQFNFDKLREVTGVITRNLNNVIDINYYPVEETRTSNMRHRPIGIGIQGLADTFAMLKMAFDSPGAAALNRAIAEHMYYAAIDMSCQLAEQYGPYDSFVGSPASQGKFQFDMWPNEAPRYTGHLDWEGLRARMVKYGLRNSLCIALMPTASTSQILGNNESFEPFTSNLYVRRVLAGEFICANKHLVRDLEEIGLWTPAMQAAIVRNKGRIGSIESIPLDIRERYKTVWEIRQKILIDQSRDRAPFICQSQSLNLFFEKPSIDVLSTALFYGWRRGLVTLNYYIRTQAAKVQAFEVQEPACATCTA